MRPFRVQAFPVGAVIAALLGLVLLLGNSTTQWFLIGSVALGGVVAAILWRSRAMIQIDLAQEEKRPEISIHRIPVGGGVAGLIFGVGTCTIFLIGIPALRWFLLAAVALGSLVGGLLWRWHKKRPIELTDIRDL